jgi:hypothetical protein
VDSVPRKIRLVKEKRLGIVVTMEVEVKKKKANNVGAVEHYAAALEILDKYLDLVELPPIDSGHYDKEFDTLVGESARIT